MIVMPLSKPAWFQAKALRRRDSQRLLPKTSVLESLGHHCIINAIPQLVNIFIYKY
jgi:hypothetical protein